MKNLTLRERIIASFLVILAIMALMVVVDYQRLLQVEAEAKSINTDAVPGIYYSTSIRSSWFAGFVAVQDASIATPTRNAAPAWPRCPRTISSCKKYRAVPPHGRARRRRAHVQRV